MAKSGAARSGPFSGFVLANPERIMSNKRTRSAMTTQESMKLARVRVVPGILRISDVVRIGGKSG
jgi:hypothetical protein